MPDFIFRGRKPVNADISAEAFEILVDYMRRERVGVSEGLAQILSAFHKYEVTGYAGLAAEMREANERLEQAETTIAGLRAPNSRMEVRAGGS